MPNFSRRGFLGAISAAVVGACVATTIPTAWLPLPVQRWAACEYLQRHLLEWYSIYGLTILPGGLLVGRELFEAYEEECLTNMPQLLFTMSRYPGSLVFKGCPILPYTFRGWHVQILSRAEWALHVGKTESVRPYA